MVGRTDCGCRDTTCFDRPACVRPERNGSMMQRNSGLKKRILAALLAGFVVVPGVQTAWAQDFTNYDSRTAGSLTVTAGGDNTFTTTAAYNHAAALSVGNANVSITAGTTNTFTVASGGAGIKAALMAGNGGSFTVTAEGDNTFSGGEKGLFAVNQANVSNNGANKIEITSNGGSNSFSGSVCGLRIGKSDGKDTINGYLRTVLGQATSGTYDPAKTPGYSVTITAAKDNTILGGTYGIYTDAKSKIDITAGTGTNTITSSAAGIFANYGNQVSLQAGKGNNVSGDFIALRADNGSTVTVKTTSGDNVFAGSGLYSVGVSAMNRSSLSLTAGDSGSNIVKAGGYLYQALGNSQSSVTLTAGANYIGETDAGDVPFLGFVGSADAGSPEAAAVTDITAKMAAIRS